MRYCCGIHYSYILIKLSQTACMHAGQDTLTHELLQTLLITSNMTVILDAGQAFASGLDINPACERLQAGLTEAGLSLDGRLLVAALDRAASAAVATPAGTPDGGAGSGEGLRQAHAPGARGQQRGDAGAVHVYQLNMELRLSKVHICAAGISGQKHMRRTCHCVCWLHACNSSLFLHSFACSRMRGPQEPAQHAEGAGKRGGSHEALCDEHMPGAGDICCLLAFGHSPAL